MMPVFNVKDLAAQDFFSENMPGDRKAVASNVLSSSLAVRFLTFFACHWLTFLVFQVAKNCNNTLNIKVKCDLMTEVRELTKRAQAEGRKLVGEHYNPAQPPKLATLASQAKSAAATKPEAKQPEAKKTEVKQSATKVSIWY